MIPWVQTPQPAAELLQLNQAGTPEWSPQQCWLICRVLLLQALWRVIGPLILCRLGQGETPLRFWLAAVLPWRPQMRSGMGRPQMLAPWQVAGSLGSLALGQAGMPRWCLQGSLLP